MTDSELKTRQIYPFEKLPIFDPTKLEHFTVYSVKLSTGKMTFLYVLF